MPTYPYTSGQSALVQTFAQLRKGFPKKVDAGYLQRFGIAPANESYIISILRFLELINEEGDRRDEHTDFFFGSDENFQPGLEARVRAAYSQLFDEMGDEALVAERDGLTHWFRASDKTSALVGQRQATTFQSLTALAGHGEVPASRTPKPKAPRSDAPNKKHAVPKTVVASSSTSKAAEPKAIVATPAAVDAGVAGMGLTVRVEVNLPPGGDAQTYDAIFASIRKHLM